MIEIKDVSTEIKKISSSLSKLNFSNIFDINKISLNLSRVFSDLDIDNLENVRNAFGPINDYVEELSACLKSCDFIKEQNIFISGQLSAMSMIINDLYKTILKQNAEEIDIANYFIKKMIIVLGAESALSHKELSKRMDQNPASLTMRLSRNPSWRKYISVYTNPVKQNSVVYVLNGTGKRLYSDYIYEDTEISTFIEKRPKVIKGFNYFYKGEDYNETRRDDCLISSKGIFLKGL